MFVSGVIQLTQTSLSKIPDAKTLCKKSKLVEEKPMIEEIVPERKEEATMFRVEANNNADEEADDFLDMLLGDNNDNNTNDNNANDNNANPNEVASPMPGVVEKLSVKVGDVVEPNDVIAVISAMKMEIKVTVPDVSSSGKMKIGDLSVSVGDQLVEGALVAVLKEV